MPQQAQAQTPGEDVLLDTLRRSHITDDQRQGIWDAYHTQGDTNAFVGALNKLDFLPDDAKQFLYDVRFKGFQNLPTKGPEAGGSIPQLPAGTVQTKPGGPLYLGYGRTKEAAEGIPPEVAARHALSREGKTFIDTDTSATHWLQNQVAGALEAGGEVGMGGIQLGAAAINAPFSAKARQELYQGTLGAQLSELQ